MYATEKSNGGTLDLEIEYSPSRNTKRFQEYANPEVKVIQQFLEVSFKETQILRSKYLIHENIQYGKGSFDNQLLDIYCKAEEKDSPIFVFIHGGFWQELDKSTTGSFVGPLVERGQRVLVVDYNLCPTVKLEQLMEQMLDLYEWIFKYAVETSASAISFCGHSAGAHLAVLLFNWTKLINLPGAGITRAFFLISGVYDLRELWQLPCVNPKNILSLDLEKATKLSPICWNLDDKLIKFFKECGIKIHVLVGKFESVTFIGQSRKFYEKLKSIRLEAEFKIFENYDHFNIIQEAAIETSPICSYVLENL